jgi:hypothetical protein
MTLSPSNTLFDNKTGVHLALGYIARVVPIWGCRGMFVVSIGWGEYTGLRDWHWLQILQYSCKICANFRVLDA